MKVMNKNLKPGMVLVGGLTIIRVKPTLWSKEVEVTYQRPGKPIHTSLWSANSYKVVL